MYTKAIESARKEIWVDDVGNEGEEPASDPLEPPKPFLLPSLAYREKLAIYYCNRAAVYLNLQEYDQVISDCDIAIACKPDYTVAYMRRSRAYEELGATDKALVDARAALELDPDNADVQASVKRLSEIEEERME
jgi:tetratricopeptide (TPR) repeat protein